MNKQDKTWTQQQSPESPTVTLILRMYLVHSHSVWFWFLLLCSCNSFRALIDSLCWDNEPNNQQARYQVTSYTFDPITNQPGHDTVTSWTYITPFSGLALILLFMLDLCETNGYKSSEGICMEFRVNGGVSHHGDVWSFTSWWWLEFHIVTIPVVPHCDDTCGCTSCRCRQFHIVTIQVVAHRDDSCSSTWRFL